MCFINARFFIKLLLTTGLKANVDLQKYYHLKDVFLSANFLYLDPIKSVRHTCLFAILLNHEGGTTYNVTRTV